MTRFDPAVFGDVDPDGPCLDEAGQPLWVDDHNQPLTWSDAFSLWETLPETATNEPGPADDPPH